MLADLIVSLSRGSPPSHNAQWQSVAARNEGVFNIFPEASIVRAGFDCDAIRKRPRWTDGRLSVCWH